MEITSTISITDNGGYEGFIPPISWFGTDAEVFGSDMPDVCEEALEDMFSSPRDDEKRECIDVDTGEEFVEMSPRELGKEGERLAATYLSARGYTIIERNWRCSEGEVDIICEDDDGTTVLVEVKTRQTRHEDAHILPELSVDENKQHKLSRLALWYLVNNPNAHSVRFDVIAINVVSSSSARLRHLIGAFSWDE